MLANCPAGIAENSRRINEQLRALKGRQRRLGLRLSRISPASAFQLVALEVAGTGLQLGDRYTESIEEYRKRFTTFVEERGGNRMVMRAGHHDDDGDDGDDEEGGLFGGQGKPLDLREMPRYEPPAIHAREVVAPAVADLGLLALLIVAAFAVAFGSFLRYDVRPG